MEENTQEVPVQENAAEAVDAPAEVVPVAEESAN